MIPHRWDLILKDWNNENIYCEVMWMNLHKAIIFNVLYTGVAYKTAEPVKFLKIYLTKSY
jgi:hypothetical protein